MSEKNIERKIGEAGSKAREVDQNRVERERESEATMRTRKIR